MVRRFIFISIFILSVTLLIGLTTPSSYEPSLRGVSGYETYLATRPNVFGGMQKSFNVWLELGPTCSYDIDGWSSSNILYFSRFCGDRISKFSYKPADLKSIPVDNIPEGLSSEKLSDEKLLQLIHFPKFHPPYEEQSTRSIYLRSNTAIQSPDGKHIAFIQQALYSEFDITVISLTTP